MKDKSLIAIGVLFVFAALVSWNLYFKEAKQKDTVNIHAFPKDIEGWTSEEMEITKEELAILETENAFLRKYTHPSGQGTVYLFIVYSQHNRKVAHPPEICYTGSGVSITGSKFNPIPVPYKKQSSIPAIQLSIERGKYRQVVRYWFKVGDLFTHNYWRQQLLIALKTVTNQKAGSALIRLSADVHNGEEGKALELTNEFARLAIPYIVKYLP